jgi:hypothetical protein
VHLKSHRSHDIVLLCLDWCGQRVPSYFLPHLLCRKGLLHDLPLSSSPDAVCERAMTQLRCGVQS